MQKVITFSDPSTTYTYKIIIKQLFCRALCSYFNFKTSPLCPFSLEHVTVEV